MLILCWCFNMQYLTDLCLVPFKLNNLIALIILKKKKILFVREICAFCSRRENNHNTRISQRMAILVHNYHQYHHMRDPHSWLGLMDWFQVQYRAQKSLIARSLKSSRACNKSWWQASPDGQRQMENCKETRRHNRSVWWQQSQWFPL